MQARYALPALLLHVCSIISAQTPDLTFNATGHRQLDPTSADESGDNVVVTAGGIFVAGQTWINDQYTLLVVALNDGGSIQSSWGTSGMVQITDGDATWSSPMLRALPDGSLLLAATRSNADGRDVVLWHILVNGGIHQAFAGGAGRLVIDHAFSDDLRDVLVRPDGHILVASFMTPGMALTMIDQAGTTVSTFGTAGVVALPSSINAEVLRNAHTGGIWLAGSKYGDQNDSWVGLLEAGGDMDANFGTAGEAMLDLDPHDLPFSSDALLGLDETPGGGLLVLVNLFGDALGYGRYRLAHLTAAGQLDGGFGAAGIATLFEDNAQIRHADLLMEPDGRSVVVAGSQGQFRMEKRLPAGQLDAGWGSGGTASFAPAGVFQYFDNEAINDPNGRIVVVGMATFESGTNDITVDRFVNDWSTGIADMALPRTIVVYPDPAHDLVQWSSAMTDVRSIDVLDLNGRAVLRATPSMSHALDVSGLTPGVYVIRFLADRVMGQARFAKD